MKEKYFRNLFFFLLIMYTSSIQAQEVLKGTIEADSLTEGSVHVINITKQTGTLNSASGSFEIRINKNDTLWFTSVQYEKEEVVIDESIFQKKFIEVKLREVNIILEDVNISNISLSGNLNSDIGILETFALKSPKLSAKEINKTKFYTDIPSSSLYPDNLAFEQNRISDGKEIFDLKISLDLIGDLFRKKNTLDENNNYEVISKNIRDQFNSDFFKTTLGIEEEEIMDFIVYLNEEVNDPQLLLSSKSLPLTELLISHSFLYKVRRAGG